jgi:phosphinothricin acetyltransferase
MSHEVLIRTGRLEDLEALTGIYNHYVRETAITFDIDELSPAERRPWFEQFGETGPYRLVVAEKRGRVVGYAGSTRFRPKAAYITSVETTVYLDPGETGRGIGTRLYAALFDGLRGEDLHRAYAGITHPNPASIALHLGFDFRSIGFYGEVGRKLGRYWDVEWFEKRLGGLDRT